MNILHGTGKASELRGYSRTLNGWQKRSSVWSYEVICQTGVCRGSRAPNVSEKIKRMTPRRMRRAVHVARMEEMRNTYINIVRIPKRKRQLGWPRRRRGITLNWTLKDKGFKEVNWIHLAPDRYQWQVIVMNIQIP